MFLDSRQLQETARLKEGSLAEVPFAVLLHAISTAERSVVLEIRRNQLEKRILFEDGVPVDCRSNLLHETLGKFLVHRNKLSEDDYQRCLAESVSSDMPFGDVLMKLELVSAFDFFKMMQQNLANKLLDGFTWREGTFRMHNEVPPVDSPLKVRVPQLVFTGITRYAPQAVVDASVGPLIGTPLALHPAPPVPLSAVKLGTRHSRLASLLKQRLRMDELGVESKLPPDELTRVLFALALLGIVVPADQVPAVTTTPRAEPTPTPIASPLPTPEPTPAPAPTPSLSAAEAERLRNEVTRAFLVYRKQDAFDLLGLKVTATPGQIREAYLEFARKYAPWNFDAPELAALQEKAQDLFLAGARAFATLQDAEARNSLIYRKQNAQEAPRKDPSAYFAIRTELLDSDKQYKEGSARLSSGDFQGALQYLEFAADCDPQNGLYRADLAYCRYRVNPSRAPDIMRDLQETMRMDPECGAAVLYAGEVARALGDRANAEALLRRACKMMVGDRRPVEALKSLLTEPAR